MNGKTRTSLPEHLTWLNAMREGSLAPPPVNETIGMTLESVESGRAAFAMRANERLANPAGVVHGGMTATLLDTALTIAVITTLPADKIATTTDLHVQYVRPLLPTGEKVVAEATLIHAGTTFATAEGRLHDERGRLIAHATGSFAIIERR